MNIRKLAAAVALSAILPATIASAHASFENKEAAAGATFKAILTVPHGCDGQATQTVNIQIPEGFFSVKPMLKAGWDITLTEGAYAKTYVNHGKEVTSGVVGLTYTGNLPDNFFDQFIFRGTVDPDLAPGTPLYFIVTQTCADGEVSWSELPNPADPTAKLARPAPAITVAMPDHSGH